MQKDMLSLNKNIEIENKEVESLFEELSERQELGGCAFNFSPCGGNACAGAC